MTANVVWSSVAIDTNVLVHLLNFKQNSDCHIHRLLEFLIEQKTMLLVDDQGAINREYERHVEPILRGRSVVGNELYILTYLMSPEVQTRVSVVRNDDLMRAVLTVIREYRKHADRTFVYVAFKLGETLITNDVTDIVVGPAREAKLTPRRERLLRATRAYCPSGAEILTSREAVARIPQL